MSSSVSAPEIHQRGAGRRARGGLDRRLPDPEPLQLPHLGLLLLPDALRQLRDRRGQDGECAVEAAERRTGGRGSQGLL